MFSGKIKIYKWIIIGVLIGVLALCAVVGLFFSSDRVQNRLETMARQQSRSLYSLKLHGFTVSPLTGQFSVDSMVLTPDYERWKQLQQKEQKAPRMLFEIRTSALRASGLNLLRLVLGKPLQAGSLVIHNPDILLTAMRPDTTERYKAAYETATGIMKNMRIGSIEVKDASMQYREKFESDTFLLNLHNFSLKVKDFRLDKKSYEATERVYYARNIEFSAAKATYLFPDKLYSATIDSLYLNTSQQQIEAHKIHLKPLRTALQMSSAKGKATTSTDLKIARVSMRGVHFYEHSRNDRIIINYILASSPALKAFKDRTSGKPEESKPTLHKLAQQVKTPFRIDTFEVREGYVRYSELAPEGQVPGHITFDKFKGLATNLSNMPAYISDKKPAVIRSNFMVMNKANVQFNVKLPLLSKTGYHTIHGTIGPANPAILNAILTPVTNIKIEEGHISKGEFTAQLTDKSGSGSMLLYYNNLEVELLNKGEGGKQGLKNKVASQLADWVAIKDANPMKGEEPRRGKITVTRNPSKSVFDYWKNCFVSGFLSTMGLDKLAEK